MSGGLVIIKEHLWHNAEVEQRPSKAGGGARQRAGLRIEPRWSGSFEVAGGEDVGGKTEDKHKASKVGC